MTQPSAAEQYLLELINAERAKVGSQPLTFDSDLIEAAEGHSAWMIATDTFSHTGSGGSSAGQRMSAAGYEFTGSWAWGENITWATTRAPAGYQDEVLLLHTNLMNSSGHRTNILNDNFREIGLGFEIGEYGGRESAFVTEDFAKSGSSVFLTGVAFDDRDGDQFYDPGEGLGGLTVTAVSSAGAHYTTSTMDAGGYDLVLPAGSYAVTFSGGGIAPTTMQTTMDSKNVKLDLIDPAMEDNTPPAPPPPQPASIVGTTVQMEIMGLYAALYDRAAEARGYAYWVSQLAQQPDGAGITLANASSTLVTVHDAQILGQGFVLTQSTFFDKTYGSLNDSDFVNAMYVHISGNAGDPGGVQYWANLLQQAENAGQSVQNARAGLVGQFVQDLAGYDINTRPPGLTDQQWADAVLRTETINNKIAVSIAYCLASQQPDGAILIPHVAGDDPAYQAAIRAIQGVTSDGLTADAASSNIAHAVAAQDLTLIQPVGVPNDALHGDLDLFVI